MYYDNPGRNPKLHKKHQRLAMLMYNKIKEELDHEGFTPVEILEEGIDPGWHVFEDKQRLKEATRRKRIRHLIGVLCDMGKIELIGQDLYRFTDDPLFNLFDAGQQDGGWVME